MFEYLYSTFFYLIYFRRSSFCMIRHLLSRAPFLSAKLMLNLRPVNDAHITCCLSSLWSNCDQMNAWQVDVMKVTLWLLSVSDPVYGSQDVESEIQGWSWIHQGWRATARAHLVVVWMINSLSLWSCCMFVFIDVIVHTFPYLSFSPVCSNSLTVFLYVYYFNAKTIECLGLLFCLVSYYHR